MNGKTFVAELTSLLVTGVQGAAANRWTAVKFGADNYGTEKTNRNYFFLQRHLQVDV